MAVQSEHTSYAAVARTAGWIDKRARGRLRFDGRDAASFLHALVSNDVASLAPGQGVYATYLTPQGRMLTDLRIYHRGDCLLADVPPGLAESLAQRFDQVIFSEDVRVSDVSTSVAAIGVVGPRAAAAIAHASGADEHAVVALPTWNQVTVVDTFIARTDDSEWPSFDVFLPASSGDEFTARLAEAGAVPMSPVLFDALRIEASRPAFGVDMTTDTIPLEAGLLERAISQSKGCYVGQEVVVRVLHRGHGRVARRLVKVEFDLGDGAPPSGASILVNGAETGKITSAATSPHSGHAVALGYVHRDAAEVGTRVTVRSDAADLSGTVTAVVGS
jgi:folate-binding protein YgfZ